MALLSVEELDLAFGDRPIFVGASLALQPRDRLGIVGPNGAGKSTLLKILSGAMEPDGGRISRARGCRVGYLPQEHSDPGTGALLQTVLAGAPGRDEVNERIAEVEAELDRTDDTDRQIALAQELAELHTRASVIDSQFGPHRAQSILAGLGFSQSDFTRPVSEFSGGWRMRAALAELLYQLPDVLLLDEPTNHLDMPSVAWLSDFLNSCNRAVILTCHDREFLNRHVNRIASLEIAGLRTFRGNYDEYLVQRDLELEHLEAKQRKDDQRRKDLEAFVERFRAKATKARQAQSKAKLIEKLQKRQTNLPEVHRPVTIQFPPAVRTGSTVLTLSGIGHAYGSHRVFDGVDLQVARGDRIAVVGVNGAGKTTLLRIAAGDITPTSGAVELGHNVTRSYFAQHQAEILSPAATVLDEVHAAAPHMSQTQARTLCGAFLFSGDDVEKQIGVLSGGEKTRVALACMLAAPANLLLLDEPTNHLDTESADKLTESLQDYDGTLMFVSHNLDFARRLSNKVWDVSSGQVEIYPGSLGEYLVHLELRAQIEAAEGSKTAQSAARQPNEDAATRKEARKAERSARIRRNRERGTLQKRIEKVESQIAEAEQRQQEIETQLASPGDAGHDALRALAETYEATKAELEEAFAMWEKLSADLELH